MNIAELTIANVSQRESVYFTNVFYITFEIDGFGYSMFIKQAADGLIHPQSIDHLIQNGTCKYCKNRSTLCPVLNDYKKELFHRLIDFPSIPLEWLYIDHV